MYILEHSKEQFSNYQNNKIFEDRLVHMIICRNFSKLLDLYNSYSIDVETLKKSFMQRCNFERFDMANKRILNKHLKKTL